MWNHYLFLLSNFNPWPSSCRHLIVLFDTFGKLANYGLLVVKSPSMVTWKIDQPERIRTLARVSCEKTVDTRERANLTWQIWPHRNKTSRHRRCCRHHYCFHIDYHILQRRHVCISKIESLQWACEPWRRAAGACRLSWLRLDFVSLPCDCWWYYREKLKRS